MLQKYLAGEVILIHKPYGWTSFDAVKKVKQVMRSGLEANMETALDLEVANFGLCFGRPESREGMQAFIEKRLPQF